MMVYLNILGSENLNEAEIALLEKACELTVIRQSQLIRLLMDEEIDVQFDLEISNDAKIREVNREFRKIDQPTDVLSFPFLNMREGELLEEVQDFHLLNPADEYPVLLLGTLMISKERCAAQAVEYGHSFERELCFLLVHGCLHIMGYDHQEKEEEARMREQQRAVLNALGLSRGEEYGRF